MPEETLFAQELPSAEASIAPAPSDRRMRWFELSFVLLLALGQYFLTNIYMLSGARYLHQADSSFRLFSLLQETTSLLLLGYVLSRRRLRFRDLGLRWSIRDLGSGAAVTIAGGIACYSVYFLIPQVERILMHSSAIGQTSYSDYVGPSMIPLLLLNPFFEELIVRAYLMTEVRELTGSPMLAVLVSVAVQTSYHLYKGWRGAISLTFMFLVFSVYYSRTRRITPVILAHEVFDLATLYFG
jgi:membrane protease YdiL (CAAX protease family)